MTQQITKQIIDAIVADVRFPEANEDMPGTVIIAAMLVLAAYRKTLPGDEAIARQSAEGQQPPESGQGPAADTQSANEHKPGSAVSLSTVLAQFLTVADESQPESASEFESECPVFAQVASLTEQVKTLQDDVKMLVEICRSQQNQLKLLKEAVFTNANFFSRKVANGN